MLQKGAKKRDLLAIKLGLLEKSAESERKMNWLLHEHELRLMKINNTLKEIKL